MSSSLLGILVVGDAHTRFVAVPHGILAARGRPVRPEVAVERISDATSRGGRWFAARRDVPDDPRRVSGLLTAFYRVTRSL